MEPELYLLEISLVKIIHHKYPLFLFIFWWNYFAFSWKYCVAGGAIIGWSSISSSSGDAVCLLVLLHWLSSKLLPFKILPLPVFWGFGTLCVGFHLIILLRFLWLISSMLFLSPPFLMLCHLLQEHPRNVLNGLPLLPHPFPSLLIHLSFCHSARFPLLLFHF